MPVFLRQNEEDSETKAINRQPGFQEEEPVFAANAQMGGDKILLTYKKNIARIVNAVQCHS